MKFKKEIGDKLWFMSDPHYWHKNIAYGESVWNDKEDRCRYFDTTSEMSRLIVEEINNYVDEDDILFNLGDWSFGGIQNIWNFRKQLNVKTIHQINGNHDHHIIKNKELPNCHRSLNGNCVDYYDDTIAKANAQDVFTSVNDYLEILIGKQKLCTMHYPFESWNEMGKGSIMLHGHIHGEKYIKKNRLDVGIDNAFKLFGKHRPFNYNEILEIFKNR
jgi:calcineurin-like phosphoesterase family protein